MCILTLNKKMHVFLKEGSGVELKSGSDNYFKQKAAFYF